MTARRLTMMMLMIMVVACNKTTRKFFEEVVLVIKMMPLLTTTARKNKPKPVEIDGRSAKKKQKRDQTIFMYQDCVVGSFRIRSSVCVCGWGVSNNDDNNDGCRFQ